MALERAMANGREAACPKCGDGFKPGKFKVKRPTNKPPGYPGVETLGGKTFVWVHEKCAPTRIHRKKLASKST